jgi:hypothetical protein
MNDTTTTLSLVNLSPVDTREVLVQAGAYGEHQITSVTEGDESYHVDSPFVTVKLSPGTGTKLVLGTERFVNQPTFVFPWDRE